MGHPRTTRTLKGKKPKENHQPPTIRRKWKPPTNDMPTIPFHLLTLQKTNMTLDNPHFQWEIHLQMLDFPLPCYFTGGYKCSILMYIAPTDPITLCSLTPTVRDRDESRSVPTTDIHRLIQPMAARHLLVEFQMDLFQLLDRRQPPPRQGHGLPEAWVLMVFWLF